MKTLYLAKEPGTGVRDDLSRISGEFIVVDCLNAYGDYYRKKGYDCVSWSSIDCLKGMKFDLLIGNPPYDNGMYRDFLSIIPQMIDPDGKFDLLFPVYTFTRKKCIDILKRTVKIENIDMTAGHYFKDAITGAWVVRITGRRGVTDKFRIVFPDGGVLENRTVDDINPSSAKFIEHIVKYDLSPLTTQDYTIAQKVLTSTNQLSKHKKNDIIGNHVYLHPSIHQMSKKKESKFPGAFSLRGFYNTKNDKTKDGYYQVTDTPEQAEQMYNILCQSKLFVYLYWIVASDSPYTDSFIKSLPDVSGMSYESDYDLYKQFGLTADEVERIESVVTSL